MRFVKRALGIGFSLDEIAKLLRFREQPMKCSDVVRALAGRKYEHLRVQRREIQKMEQERRLCRSASGTHYHSRNFISCASEGFGSRAVLAEKRLE